MLHWLDSAQAAIEPGMANAIGFTRGQQRDRVHGKGHRFTAGATLSNHRPIVAGRRDAQQQGWGLVEYDLRQAMVRDVPQMQKLVNWWAKQGAMLPRSLHSLYEHIRDYTVAVENGRVIGCVSLHVSWEDLAEIRTLAVAADYHEKGIGRALVQEALQDAKRLGLTHIFVLTYVPGFFGTMGFQTVNKGDLPQKIWQDCVHCPHFPDCDETAMTLDLD